MFRGMSCSSWITGISSQLVPTNKNSRLQTTDKTLPASSGPRTACLPLQMEDNSPWAPWRGAAPALSFQTNWTCYYCTSWAKRKLTKKRLFHTIQAALRGQIFAVIKDLRTAAMLKGWEETDSQKQAQAATGKGSSKPGHLMSSVCDGTTPGVAVKTAGSA